jgi:hypothetical protein
MSLVRTVAWVSWLVLSAGSGCGDDEASGSGADGAGAGSSTSTNGTGATGPGSTSSGDTGGGGGDDGPCSSSFADVSLPLCDGTYTEPVQAGTFPVGATVRAQHAGSVVFTGPFSPDAGLTFRGIVVKSSSQKALGDDNLYEDISFVGGPECGNTVNAAIGAGTTIRRSAFYGRGGRYQVLAYQVSGVTLEDVIIRSDGGWGMPQPDNATGCSEYEPNAALNFYDSSNVSCTRCVLFDGISEADESSETLGGLGVNCHESADDQVFESCLIVASQGGFYADGNGSCGATSVTNSASYGTEWGIRRNVGGTTTATSFTTDGSCGAFDGEVTLVDSNIQGQNSGCSGSTSGAGGMPALDVAFLDAPRWRKELCTDAGETRGWCSTPLSLSQYLASVSN